WSGRRDGLTIVRRDPGALAPEAARYATLPPGHPQGYADCFDAFVAEFYAGIRADAAPEGLPTFADGLRATVLTEAVLASSADRRWTEVESLHPTRAA